MLLVFTMFTCILISLNNTTFYFSHWKLLDLRCVFENREEAKIESKS